MRIARTTVEDDGGIVAQLWIGILGPPVIWSIRFAASYLLVPYACWWDRIELLHAVTLLALGATALAGWIAYRAGRSVREGPGSEDVVARTRFMVKFGLFSSGIFAVVIVAEGLASLFLDPCVTAGTPIA